MKKNTNLVAMFILAMAAGSVSAGGDKKTLKEIAEKITQMQALQALQPTMTSISATELNTIKLEMLQYYTEIKKHLNRHKSIKDYGDRTQRSGITASSSMADIVASFPQKRTPRFFTWSDAHIAEFENNARITGLRQAGLL